MQPNNFRRPDVPNIKQTTLDDLRVVATGLLGLVKSANSTVGSGISKIGDRVIPDSDRNNSEFPEPYEDNLADARLIIEKTISTEQEDGSIENRQIAFYELPKENRKSDLWLQKYADFYNGLSPESRKSRFDRVMTNRFAKLNKNEKNSLTFDGKNKHIVCVDRNSEEGLRMIAEGSYSFQFKQETRLADFSIMVSDEPDCRQKGIASTLIRELIFNARENGVLIASFQYSAGNKAVEALNKKLVEDKILEPFEVGIASGQKTEYFGIGRLPRDVSEDLVNYGAILDFISSGIAMKNDRSSERSVSMQTVISVARSMALPELMVQIENSNEAIRRENKRKRLEKKAETT